MMKRKHLFLIGKNLIAISQDYRTGKDDPTSGNTLFHDLGAKAVILSLQTRGCERMLRIFKRIKNEQQRIS